MITFTAYRPAVPASTHNEYQRNAAHAPQFEGVIFTDGTCAIRWLTACRSTSVWNSVEDMLRIHGHPEYGTHFKSSDPDQYWLPLWWLQGRGVYLATRNTAIGTSPEALKG